MPHIAGDNTVCSTLSFITLCVCSECRFIHVVNTKRIPTGNLNPLWGVSSQKKILFQFLVIPFFVVVVAVVAETIKLTQQYDVVERVSIGLDVLLLIICVHGKRGGEVLG